MTILTRPSSEISMLGGTIPLPPVVCRHTKPAVAHPWTGTVGTVGTVAVVGAGKMGLPLAVQFTSHGWTVIAVDVNPTVVASINEGRSHIAEEPQIAPLVEAAHREGRLTATTDGAAAAKLADVVVLIVPVMLNQDQQPDYRYMDPAVAAIGPGVHEGSTIIFETTLPLGVTRSRFVPALETATGLRADKDFFVAFSPERLFTGTVLKGLAAYPKLVGGIGPVSTDRAAHFYDSVLDADVVAMSSAEAAEFAKLADTTYRDVNIALANEFARVANRFDVNITEVIAAANSQPYSHIHQPGIGVGGHCIPVYPHLLLAGDPGLEVVALARRVNDNQVQLAISEVSDVIGDLAGKLVLVLGLTYRNAVREMAYSVALRLIPALAAAGADVWGYDPLLTDDEVRALGAAPWHWGDRAPFEAIITQTADPKFSGLDPSWFADLRALYDGRNSLRDLGLPEGVNYLGVGVQQRGARATE